MLTRVQEQLGLKGLSRVLLDSFNPDEFEQLIEECGLESQARDSSERKALGLANLISSWPQLAAETSRLLDSANDAVVERIKGLNDEALLGQFSPQNAEMDVSPGRLLWALLRCGDRPACRELLRVWVDFLARPAQASPDTPETHVIDEQNVLEAERRAVALFAEDMEQSPDLSDEALRQQGERVAEEKVPMVHPRGFDKPLEENVQDLSPVASSGDTLPVRPVEKAPLMTAPTVSREDPGAAAVDLTAAIKQDDSEEVVTSPANAEPAGSPAKKETLLDSVVAIQKALERHLKRIESRLNRLENLSQSLKKEIETVKSEEQHLLSLRIEQAASLLTAVQEQSQVIQSRLVKIPSGTHPTAAEEPGAVRDMGDQQEELSVPEEEVGATGPTENSSAESLAEERPAEPVPAGKGVPPAKVSAQTEQGSGGAPAVPVGEAQDGKRVEISGAGEEEAQGALELGGSFSEPPEEVPSLEPVFQNETIVIVGGHDPLAGDYRALIEGLGGRFERYASVDEFSGRWLEDLVDRAYLVVVLGNVATQRGVMSLMEVASRLGRRFFVHHSTAPASVHQFLLRLVEGETI